MRNILIIIFAICLTSCRDKTCMSIILTGDVILDRGVNDEIRFFGGDKLVNSLKNVYKKDFLVINYEGTFTDSKQPQEDKYNFKADKSKASILKQGGVTHISVANNHVYDYGQIGYENTIDAIISNNLIPLGESCEPKILVKRNYKCAILSASISGHNDSLCISSIYKLEESIKQFRYINKTVPLILYIHWGFELQPKPEKWQKELAINLIKLGVNAIVGHHPHIIQPIEFIDDAPVFYSIGNFIWDIDFPNTENSYTVEFRVSNKIDNIIIRPIKIENCFPCEIQSQNQPLYIKNLLFYSTGICAIRVSDYWEIKPDYKVNFKEKSDLWIFIENKITAAIKGLKSGTKLLTIYLDNDTSNTINLNGELSELQIADINNDDNSDILLGISKKVNFDPIIKKRINVFSYQNKNLQPLWLGTKFIYEINEFDIMKIDDYNYLTTIETDEENNSYQGIYKWDNFGFALKKLNKINTNENY